MKVIRLVCVVLSAILVFGCMWCVAVPDASAAETGPARPNLILLLADDLGYGDLSCYGGRKIDTPNLDALAADGMRLTQFYSASAVCSPTRMSVLTGRYPLRFDCRKHQHGRNVQLPSGTVTLPGLLRQTGYATAHIGKWHLSYLYKKDAAARLAGKPAVTGPLQHGFEHYLAMFSDQRGSLAANRRMHRDGCRHLVRNDRPVEPISRHWTDYKVDEAIAMIEQYDEKKRPFFLNLWFDIPHTPYEPAPEPHLSKYQNRAQGDDLLYRSMVSHLDANVGRLVTHLKQLGIYRNTFILFASDNGPSSQGSSGPWKGGKADLHEGGIRVPMFAVWPGHIPMGTRSDTLAHTNDILPTFCAAAGIALPESPRFDGCNLLPHLTGGKPLAGHDGVFWQMDLITWYPQPGSKPEPYATEIVRRGKWKLMAADGKPVELFDLHTDPQEKVDLLDQHGDLAEQLAGQLRAWLAEPRESWLIR